MYGLDSNSTIVGRRPIPFILKECDMKKRKEVKEKETEEQKQERWNKMRKLAKSFAKQAGIKQEKKKEKQSEHYDY
jgi:hypothetical protein